MKPKFGFIENSGPNNLRDILKAVLPRASEVFIAVAFVTQSGLEGILELLRAVAIRGRVRLLTGLYQRVTEPLALETLLNIQDENRERFQVRLSRDPEFHRKIYLLEGRTRAEAIVGSSNLTKEGLQSGGELNVMLSLPRTSPSIKELRSILETGWEPQGTPLTEEQIRKYRQSRPEAAVRNSYSPSQLGNILGVQPIHSRARPEPTRFWRDNAAAYVSKRTQKIVSETTDWDEKGYYSIATLTYQYRKGDHVFLFDNTIDELWFVEVKATTRTPVPTPDGRRFAAYKLIEAYRRRRLTPSLWKLLAEEGINKRNYTQRARLSDAKAKSLMKALRKPKRA